MVRFLSAWKSCFSSHTQGTERFLENTLLKASRLPSFMEVEVRTAFHTGKGAFLAFPMALTIPGRGLPSQLACQCAPDALWPSSPPGQRAFDPSTLQGHRGGHDPAPVPATGSSQSRRPQPSRVFSGAAFLVCSHHPVRIRRFRASADPFSGTQGGLNLPSCMHCCCRAVVHSHPTLCAPVDCSPPGSSVHGISQARILEWVAISYSRASSQPVDQTHIPRIGRWILNHEPPGKPLAYNGHLLIIALFHPITCLKGATSQQVRTIQRDVCCIRKQRIQGRNPALLAGPT